MTKTGNDCKTCATRFALVQDKNNVCNNVCTCTCLADVAVVHSFGKEPRRVQDVCRPIAKCHPPVLRRREHVTAILGATAITKRTEATIMANDTAFKELSETVTVLAAWKAAVAKLVDFCADLSAARGKGTVNFAQDNEPVVVFKNGRMVTFANKHTYYKAWYIDNFGLSPAEAEACAAEAVASLPKPKPTTLTDEQRQFNKKLGVSDEDFLKYNP